MCSVGKYFTGGNIPALSWSLLVKSNHGKWDRRKWVGSNVKTGMPAAVWEWQLSFAPEHGASWVMVEAVLVLGRSIADGGLSVNEN